MFMLSFAFSSIFAVALDFDDKVIPSETVNVEKVGDNASNLDLEIVPEKDNFKVLDKNKI